MHDQEFVASTNKVREHVERSPVEFWIEKGRLVLRCYNVCGNEHTSLDVIDLLEWLKTDDGLKLLQRGNGMARDAQLDKEARIALALKRAAREFRDPVDYYVEEEYRHRRTKEDAAFEPEYSEAETLESWKILARAALAEIDK